MTLLNSVIIVSIITTSIFACGLTNPKSDQEITATEPEYSLKLSDSTIVVDSVSARLWFNEELSKDIMTCKIYCTSGYPIAKNDLMMKDNKIMFLKAQAVAEPGKHTIQHNGDDWVNMIGYESSNSAQIAGQDPTGKRHWFYINTIDKENQLVSFEVHAGEYISLFNSTSEIRKVVFIGKNIPYSKSL